MELKDVILGFLEWKQLTGYELKSLFAERDYLPWSGNNNQVYKALLELDREGLVEKRIIAQEKLPAQKRYRATAAGRRRLREAVLREPEAVSVRNDFLLHLAWSECLSTEEVQGLVDAYQRTMELELAMCGEKIRRQEPGAGRSAREDYVWEMILRNRSMMLQAELDWLALLRGGLAGRKGKART
jgi:PadR family transcriptional regulator, regulatory protein AphA